jgi:ABC-2 type transport system permease protein
LLPPFWQKVALVNPILYMVNAFRYGMLGKSDIPILWAYTIMIAFAAALFASVLVMLHRGTGVRG